MHLYKARLTLKLLSYLSKFSSAWHTQISQQCHPHFNRQPQIVTRLKALTGSPETTYTNNTDMDNLSKPGTAPWYMPVAS